MTDSAQRLREALNQAHAGNAEVDASCAKIHGAAFALLDALPEMLQAARADAWDVGVENACSIRNVTNPYRVAAADELARETREQGYE